MPGIIRVSVLDFARNDDSLPDSKMCVKVSLGNKEFQTFEKGEFSFPLTSMRDNLIVTLLDKEGNQISNAGVETRMVIEKGVWDNKLVLENGYVHMKLQFALSEEDREKIRATRTLAAKRKHDELLQKLDSPLTTAVAAARRDPHNLSNDIENSDVSFDKGKRSPKGDEDALSSEKKLSSVPADTDALMKNEEDYEKTSLKKHGSEISRMLEIFEGRQDMKLIETEETPEEESGDEAAGVWIFPDEGRRTCISATAKKAYTDDAMAEVHPALSATSDDGASETPTRFMSKVMKVAVVVGFAALIVFNRR